MNDELPAHTWQSTTVGSEGGPLLVCEADAFPEWGGALHDSAYTLDPACDYARAWSAVHPSDDDLEAAFVRFGAHGQHTGLVWEMDGEGSAEIAYGPAGTFLLTRSWLPRDRRDAPRRRAAGASPAQETEVGELQLPGGRAVVVWAAEQAAGAVLRVEPGTYRVTCGWHEGTRGRYLPQEEMYGPPRPYADDDWSCRWVRFTRSDA
ncbi:hypothetical protein ABZX85_48995 [Streptomyces sp. NPDC004539]|uniref:hypothetical protein n=1 Tax=Streptomyces sp. NPDC004539 TaxID=3154280 RepID=UPI0033A64208